MTALLILFSLVVGVTVLVTRGSGASDRSIGAEAEPPLVTATATLPTNTIPVTFYVDLPEPVQSRVREAVSALSREIGLILPETPQQSAASLAVSFATAGQAGVVIERWLPVAGLWSLRETLSLSDADVPLLLPEEWRDELTALLGNSALSPSVRWAPLREVRAALAANGALVSLLPLSALVDAPMRRLHLADGRPWLEQRLLLTVENSALAAFGRQLEERLQGPPAPVTTIAFTGDIIPARCVYERQRNLGDYTAAFAHVSAYLSSADIAVGSLDASISDVGEPYGCEETFNLNAPSQSVEGFVAAGFDVITVATNHAMDCGSVGIGCHQSILDTLAHLDGAGIATVGGGADLTAARQPVVIERNGVRFAFLGYDDIASSFFGATETAPGTAPLSEQALRTDIAAAMALADVVIVLPQWGVEYTPTPTERQLRLGRVALEAGASMVVGNHPHVVQGAEAGPGVFIAYALGNFVFDQDWSLETQQGAILEATFSGARLINVTFRPVRILNMFQPTFAGEMEAIRILERMRLSSEALELR